MDTDALVRDARLAFERRDRDAVVQALGTLVRLRPSLSTTWGPLSRMAGAIGEVTLAIECARLHAAQAPNDIQRQQALASTLSGSSRTEEAVALEKRLVEQAPGHAAPHHNLGLSLIQLGQTAEAEAHLRRAIELAPNASPSWLPLSGLVRFTPGCEDLRQLLATMPPPSDTPTAIRGSLHYALGKALDDCEEIEEAFAAYSRGAGIIRTELPYEENEGAKFVEELGQEFNAQFLADLAPSGIDENRPIFVFGLPRSGTTLVEQILVAHSHVSQGAELGIFRHAAMAIERFSPKEVHAFLARRPNPTTAWRRIGEIYLHLLTERFGPKGRIVDKSLSTPYMLGVIAHVFPNAQFIWMKREMGAVAWSCFKTRFSQGQNWSWSLQEIASHARVIEGLHAHWTRLLPHRILTIQYEDLVDAPNTWIPRILTHVGLEDEAQTRRFYEVPRVVQTASSMQVRKPLYKGSGDAWQRYRKHMAPFFEAYERRS